MTKTKTADPKAKAAPDATAEAEADAKAKAEAEATAAAETGQTDPENPEEAGAKQAEAEDLPPLDVARIRRLADMIENRQGQNINILTERLEREEGLVIHKGDEIAPAQLVMAGISAKLTKNPATSLQNWANSARRALLRAV